MTTKNRISQEKGLKLYCLVIAFLLIALPVQAIQWTYYDIGNNTLQNPTIEEIESTAVMRVSDTGVTQYILEIDHDFSGTWGTGYLENIGNPNPDIGKHWININDEVTCNVDGIVQDVYNLNSRYITTGYFAQGPPNSKDAANALLFDGFDDYVRIDNLDLINTTFLEISFRAKRDRTNQPEWMMSHPSSTGSTPGFFLGFDENDLAVLGTNGKATNGNDYFVQVTANRPTDTGWYHWRFVIEYYPYTYQGVAGQGIKLYIFRDGVELAFKTIIPDHWDEPFTYEGTAPQKGCYLTDFQSGNLLGGKSEKDNSQFVSECEKEWGVTLGDYSDNYNSGHPLQICASYFAKEYNPHPIFEGMASLYRCDQCYPKGAWVTEDVCKTSWWAKGTYDYHYIERYNSYDYTHLLSTKNVPATLTDYNYYCKTMQYITTGPIYIGQGYSGGFFQGKLKDIDIRKNGWLLGKWYFNDGNASAVAADTSGSDRNGSLVNFDTTKCWVINPELTKYYKNEKIQERQSIPRFKMTGPAKIIYDWGRQHAVMVNTLPDTLSHLVSIQVIDDETQSSQSGSGKYWYNHATNLVIRAQQDSCQKLSGYRDNINDPTNTIPSNEKNIFNLKNPENFSWVYSSFLFEETVTIGSPVLLSNLPPDLLQRIDKIKKPRYISTEVTEKDMCYWNNSEKRMFPLRGEKTFDLEYDLKDADCDNVKVIVRINAQWPETPHIIHVAKTPPVNLDPQINDDVASSGLKYAMNDAVVSDNKFSATEKGRSVLQFMRNYIPETLPKEVSLSFDGNGYAETEPIGLSKTFTIEFFAKRHTSSDFNILIGQGKLAAMAKSLIIGFENNNFIFHYYGYALTTPSTYIDNEWHHWACVYETDTSEMNDNGGTIYTGPYICDNDPDNIWCHWSKNCYTENFIGDYETINNQLSWNHIAKAQRRCGNNIKYKRKIYCDGDLVAETTIEAPYKGSGNIRIGMLSFQDIGGFQGQMDELRIWSVAKTKEEIEASMNSRLVGNEDHLKAYYRMDKTGASYLEDNRTHQTPPVIATLKNMDPSNSWRVDTDKSFSLDPSEISTSGTTCIRVVETKTETENIHYSNSPVGYEITGYGMHDNRVPHNGYVFFEKVPYNNNIYNRNNLKGAIYPVNTKNPDPDGRDKILVIWYTQQDNVSWPYQPAEYVSYWPNDNNRIVIASRLGTDGKNAEGKDQVFLDANNALKNYFDPARYQNIEIYNQPDPLLPGYNPNEEHALVTASFRHSAAAPIPVAAFALRNDLNITNQMSSDYTSDPFVLVQYFDAVLNKFGMKPFKVVIQDKSCGYTFDYLMKAGDPVVAPYPLNEAIGATPPVEIFGKNGDSNQNCYWKDHKGQSWAISAAGQPVQIADANVENINADSVDYLITLQSETMVYGDRYLIKATDDRGFVGTMDFVVGSADTIRQNIAVYVNGNAISVMNDNTFTVTIKNGADNLSAQNFNLYHFESSAFITVNYWYPLQPSFWWNSQTPGNSTGNVGVSIPWLPDGLITVSDKFPQDMQGRPKAITVKYDVVWPNDVPVLRAGESLTFPGGEYRTDNTSASGLPGVLGWASGQLVYDTLNPTMTSESLFKHYLVRLIPALIERKVNLSLDDFPEELQPTSKRVDIIMNNWYFKELHAGLKKRLYYDPTTQTLCFKGFINDKTLGDDALTASPPSTYILQPNILTDRERNTIKAIEGANTAFKDAVDAIFQLSNNPNQMDNLPYLPAQYGDALYSVGLEFYKDCVSRMIADHPKQKKYINDMFYAWLGSDIENDDNKVIPKVSYGPGLSVVPNAALLDPNDPEFKNFTSGYITLVENNHPDLGALPISLYVIKVLKEKVRGAIKTVFSENVFDEKISLRHTADFGANPNDLIFQWWYREEDATEQPTPDIIPDKWLIFPDPEGKDGVGMSEISIAGAGAVLLVDNVFYVRYRHKDSDAGNPASWSQWAGAANSRPEKYIPQLAEGWIKRVLNGINPFEARINNFYNSDSPATYVSMIQQAGSRYEGPVAFNPDKDVIENVGLIELYQTVFNRAKSLSIDLEQPVCTSGVTTALLLATTRISSFYNLLGNEAYNDALDPTIGFGTSSVEYGSLAPTIFSFMNQTPTLLDEEFTLLCGRSEKGARPAYNRFLWNFTKSEGEAAYALSYNINDVDNNGFIDEADGRTLYPQGHGDAWGHYLTALKLYYDLLNHPQFIWIPRAEKFSIEGVVMDVDYYDERKFAETAAKKAKVGNELVNITYRKTYVEDPDGQWQGYKDSDKDRAWGVSGWGRRAFLGSMFDWTMANAIIPTEDSDPTHIGLKKIDRTTVAEVLEIASQARNIQQQYDNSNNGLNPLGLVSDAVPFDINPARLNPEALNAATHFEQVYENALEAMENARAVFDYANNIKNRIREVTVSEQEFADQVMDQDRDYRNQLIELFGTPYEGTIGPGKAYPPGYKGPDYYFYAYIDVNEVSDKTIPPPSQEMMVNFEPQNTLMIGNFGGNYSEFNDLPFLFTHYLDADLEGSAYAATDFSGAVDITFPISTGDYSFQAPSSWGMRKSPGEIQIALIELIKAEADLQLALAQYSGLMGEIYYKTKILQGRSDLNKSELDIGDQWKAQTEKFNAAMVTLRNTADGLDALSDGIKEEADYVAEYLPLIYGAMAADTTSAARATIKESANIPSKLVKAAAFASRASADGVETQKELAQFDIDTEIQKANYKYDIQQILAEIEGLLGNEAPTRIAIFKQREHMRQVSEKYRSLLSKGLRLLEERQVYNARVAQKTQGRRYMDMAFRVNLNQSLSKYRNAFDVAARYVYLAAKAYDYETNLSDRDPASAKPFLTDIVKQRHLGQFQNGQYILGQGGLGDILATMNINFNVLKSQMGFETPQTETGRFSLRRELFRIKDGEENRDVWKDELKKKVVDNLWTIPEFRKYCRPFAAEGTPQPGLIIDFGTNIIFGNNFFGWPLAGGDHAYDPTNYATKVRSVGVWFDGYDNTLLSETPRAYLIPVGMDVMLVPNSTTMDTREWSIVDQKLPVPLPIRGSDLNNPDWIPSLDSLDGSMIKIRRFSSFRAYHDTGYLDQKEMSYESRLVGRSVWNTRWMLIIAGGTFHYDADYGL
ncbi:MAG: hypothetical protein HQK75_17460, partial [Candidatus Magnetomorum sp.]|nr:hypothetical protein [Candidatus Magnetomorum sp.]